MIFLILSLYLSYSVFNQSQIQTKHHHFIYCFQNCLLAANINPFIWTLKKNLFEIDYFLHLFNLYHQFRANSKNFYFSKLHHCFKNSSVGSLSFILSFLWSSLNEMLIDYLQSFQWYLLAKMVLFENILGSLVKCIFPTTKYYKIENKK